MSGNIGFIQVESGIPYVLKNNREDQNRLKYTYIAME